MHSFFKFTLFVLAVVLAVSQTAQAADTYRPDLYLDGEALANNVTCWVIDHSKRAIRDEIHPLITESDKLEFAQILEANSSAPGAVGWSTLYDLVLYKLYMGEPFLTPSLQTMKAPFLGWILSEPVNSISPAEFFEQAISNAKGNVLDGLALSWNVLSERNREKDRIHSAVTTKLIDITGEMDVFQDFVPPESERLNHPELRKTYTCRGDKFGAWYHFAGTALYAYLKSNSLLAFKNPNLAKLYADITIFIEEDIVHNQFVDSAKRRNIDFAGAAFGAKLSSNLRQYKTCGAFQKSQDARRTVYLYDNPKVYGPKWHLKPGEKPWEYRKPFFP